MREKDYHRTLRGLEGGMTLVKHTVGSSFRLKSVSIGISLSSSAIGCVRLSQSSNF